MPRFWPTDVPSTETALLPVPPMTDRKLPTTSPPTVALIAAAEVEGLRPGGGLLDRHRVVAGPGGDRDRAGNVGAGDRPAGRDGVADDDDVVAVAEGQGQVARNGGAAGQAEAVRGVAAGHT